MTTVRTQLEDVIRGQRAERYGLSLVEMMVAVALLAVIILGLVAMFNQTRKAFTLGLTTMDYQDSGRMFMDMITRELEQTAPVNFGFPVTNGVNVTYQNTMNFYVDVPTNATALALPLVPTNDFFTTALQRLYFVTRYNQNWNVIGYQVDPTTVGTGVGTLYRYAATVSNTLPALPNLNGVVLNGFLAGTNSNRLAVNRILDGVVDFRVRAFDRSGRLVYGQNAPTNAIILATNYPNGETFYEFMSNAAPAYVEIELGVLEARTLERYRSQVNPTVALAFLSNHAAQVHVFRQRVALRNVDPSVVTPVLP